MDISSYCLTCLVKKQEQTIRAFPDEARKTEYMRQVLKTLSEKHEECCTPYYAGLLTRLHKSFWGEDTRFYDAEKETFNRLMLQEEAALEQEVLSSADPLAAALQIARAGNYIDFGALPKVEEDQLQEILKTAYKDSLPEDEYRIFREELASAKELVYLTDNCGEIVLDKLVIRQLARLFPDLHITVIVRGKPVLNDATLADAKAVGMTELCRVLDNGNDYAGTVLSRLSAPAREAVDRADLIISKGQGNFESLHGCGKNIYFLLLCKCDWFVKQFDMTLYAGVFRNERRLITNRG